MEKEDSDNKRKKKKEKRAFKGKPLKAGGRKLIRTSLLGRLKRKRSTKAAKKNDGMTHYGKTIQSWKQKWKNQRWRQKWKSLWGKSKWKPGIRRRWNTDRVWRRRSMKKILKKWWDKKWRRKWMKRWIDSRWLTRWNRRRLRRRKLWEKRWKKSGAKKMGLTFNEFLLTERRLKTIQRRKPEVINRRRRERHMQKEKLIREQQEKNIKFHDDLEKYPFYQRWYRTLFVQEFYGPETFGIRPSVIQFKFYMLNAIQGLVAFFLVLYSHITNKYNIPPEYALQGLYTLVYFASAMDFYGSIFGMITSHHLEVYYDRRKHYIPPKKKNNACCGCFGNDKVNNPSELEAPIDHSGSQTASSSVQQSVTSRRSIASISRGEARSKRKSRRERDEKHGRSERRQSYMSITSSSHRRAGSHSHGSRRRSKSLDAASLRKTLKKTRKGDPSLEERKEGNDLEHTRSTASTKKINENGCRGFGWLVQKCFRPGRSREFINRMGYCSWILLELAWFLNIFFTAYYSWLEVYYKNYQTVSNRCELSPRMSYCDDFESLYFFLLAVVGMTFLLRNIFVFIIGMCFSERHLRRCQSNDPNEELASTCSDTDIDYSKVPRQILIPHVYSGGKYPYILPGPCRPVDYMFEKIEKVAARNQKAKIKAGGGRKKVLKKRGKDGKRKRILSTYEREKAKVMAGYKQVRRERIPLEKGKRKPWRIPVSAGVTDVYQLPPELMTSKAWAWLYDESESSTDEENAEKGAGGGRRSRHIKWRRVRNRKPNPIDSAILTVFVDANNKSLQPTEEVIKPKLENLSDRDSTDESWSGGSGSLFESTSGESSDDEKERRESDAYMELMRHANEFERKAKAKEAISHEHL